MSGIGAVGTILATYNLQIWVPVTGQGAVCLVALPPHTQYFRVRFRTAALVVSISQYMRSVRLSEKAAEHRAVARRLAVIRAKWLTLPRELRLRQAFIDELVASTEHTIELLWPPMQTFEDPSKPGMGHKRGDPFELKASPEELSRS